MTSDYSIGIHSRRVSYLTIAAAVLVGSLGSGRALSDSVPACQAFEARLRVQTSRVSKGHRPRFTLALRNTGSTPLRLFDIRDRRRDLAHTYYELVIGTKRGKSPDILRGISDPGPISDEDYFVLQIGGTAEVAITTPLVLEALRTGSYVAHVVISGDPIQLGSRCRSTSVDFEVH